MAIRAQTGLSANLPSSAPDGDILWTTDTKQLYVGSGSGVDLIGGGGSSPSFADNEIVTGSGTSWTLAHVPIPTSGVHLYVLQYPGGPFVRLPFSAIASIIGTVMTTVASYSAGALMVDYRY
jgi:hypothetical protein